MLKSHFLNYIQKDINLYEHQALNNRTSNKNIFQPIELFSALPEQNPE